MLDIPDFLTSAFWAPNKGPELAEKWKLTIIISSLLYVPLILLGQRFMRSRQPFSIKGFVITWNILLALLSIAGSFIILVTDYKVLFCVFYDEANYKPGTRAVIALFTLTKAIEFGDTIILVLKKKSIVFLHLYHHFSVTLYCWHAQYINIYFGHHFAFINLCIHSIMYTYYGLSTLYPRNWILKFCRPYITLSQTLQMFVGSALSYIAMQSDFLPPIHIWNAKCSLLMYISYAALFSKFYIENYSKSFRPHLTLYIITLHILAIVGALFVARHVDYLRLMKEVFVGYFTTGIILWFSIKLSSTNHTSKKVSFHSSKANHQMKSIVIKMGNFSLLFLNCIAAWIKDYTLFSTLSRATPPPSTSLTPISNLTSSAKEYKMQSTLSQKASSTSSTLDGQSTSPQSPSNSESSHSCTTETSSNPKSTIDKRKNSKKSPSILMSYLNKTSQNPGTFYTNTNTSQNSNTNHTNSTFPFYPARPIGFKDFWLLVICSVAPAIYSMNVHGDFFMGLCVHGALRWVLELHTANFVLSFIFKTCQHIKIN